jgi:hypothetical protein
MWPLTAGSNRLQAALLHLILGFNFPQKARACGTGALVLWHPLSWLASASGAAVACLGSKTEAEQGQYDQPGQDEIPEGGAHGRLLNV